SKVYGETDPSFAYTNSLGLPASAFTGALGRAAGENVGTYEMTVGSLTAANYSITFVSANFTITAKPLTVTAVANSKVFGATDPTFAYTNSEGLPALTFTGSLTRVAGEDVGTYAIEQGTLAAANYSVTFVSASFTITAKPLTVTAVANSKVFGATDPALAYTNSRGLPASAFTGSLTRVAGEDVGTYAIEQGTLAAANYSITFVSASFTITAKPLTVTAVANSKVFGATDPAFAYTNSEGLPASAFTGSLTRVAGEDVGAYAIEQGTLAAANYSITFVSANFTITAKPLTVTAVANSKVFGATDPALAYTNSLSLPASAFTGSLTRVAGEDVGTYAIEQGTLAAANYSVTFVSASFTITAKPLTVTAVANSKVFGASDPALTYTNSEGLPASAFTGSLTREAGEDVGTYAIEQGTLAPANPTLPSASPNFTITAKPLTVTA